MFPDQAALAKAQQNGTDVHSRFSDPQFMEPEQGDYRVARTSPARSMGFENFAMDQFGVQKSALRALARRPQLPELTSTLAKKSAREISWLGLQIRNIRGLGERSSFGLPSEAGVLVLSVAKSNELGKAGLRQNDVILNVNGSEVATIDQLSLAQQQCQFMDLVPVRVMRHQHLVDLRLPMR